MVVSPTPRLVKPVGGIWEVEEVPVVDGKTAVLAFILGRVEMA